MRKTIIVIGSCIVALLLAFTGYRGYKVWKQSHWLEMAKASAAKNDVRNELLSLRQVLNLNPQNLEACRMMAQLANKVQSPSAMMRWQRVVDLNPSSLTDRIDLAQSAIFLRNFVVASNALAGVSDADKNTAAYQNAAGFLDVQSGNMSGALKHFSDAAKIEPDNPIPQLNLALVRLHDSNDLDMAEARINLQRLSMNATNIAVRAEAKRALVKDSLRSKNYAKAEKLVAELTESTNAFYLDRLLQLQVLQKAGSPKFKPVLADYEQEAATNSAKLPSMAIWLMANVSPGGALGWLTNLPTATTTNLPAASLIAQCQAHLGLWKSMRETLQTQNWNESDFLRHAFMARALQGLSLNEASSAEWGVAMNYASNPKNQNPKGVLLWLYGLAGEWHWNGKAEQILWDLVNQYPEEKWAGNTLAQALMDEGRTRPLMQLFGILLKREPNNVEYKNDLAFTALLLGAQEVHPNELAKEAHSEMPQNASYASTYAFSLYQQKKYAEALKVMQKLDPKKLQDPSIAGYYGLILKANGNSQEAETYLKLALNGKPLPEEKDLFQRALVN